MVVPGRTLHKFRRQYYTSRLPDITSAELSDKSEGSSFIKAIAIEQVLWNTIQIAGRASRRLTITQLEVSYSESLK